MSHYRKYAVTTYRNPGEPSTRRIRAHPLPGQGVDTSLKVECSTKMREGHPIGTIFIIDAMIKRSQDGTPYLATYHGWGYEVVTREQAEKHIAAHFTAFRA